MDERKERAIAEQIRERYTEKRRTKLDELKELDRKVKRPAEIFAYCFGIAGALVLGTGMCLAMKAAASWVPLGIVVGCVGIAMTVANYFIYKAIIKSGKRKYAKQILALSDELLHK